MPDSRTTIVALLAVLAGPGPAHAVTAPPATAAPAGGAGDSRMVMASGPAARAFRPLTWNRTPRAAARAWQAFEAEAGAGWQAQWDADTGVPVRLFGPGIPAPGSVASADRAAAYARAFLARHIALLAPGSDPADFVVAGNHAGGGMRTVGMYQHHHGMRVLSGQVSFRFKNDRLFVIAAEALPHVRAPAPALSPSAVAMAAAAERWLRADVGGPGAGDMQATAVDGPYVLPVVARGAVAYHTVMRVTAAGRAPLGRWHVYVDPHTGAPVGREQTLRFAAGTVLYSVVERYPGAGRVDAPALRSALLVNDEPQVSDESGAVSWAGDAPASVTVQVLGPLVRVDNDAADEATASFQLAAGGSVVWDARDSELTDAQINVFIHSQIAKDYVRGFAPRLPFLDKALLARVNIDSTCNAYSDGESIHFFRSSDDCENTARLADVIYHELGHTLHRQALIAGAGAFDGSFSEGLSDYLAATITNDPAMAPGFFYSDEPLRHVDPEGFEHRWPEDIEEIHYTGLIFAGAMWDLRKALIAVHGQEQGVAIADRLFFAAVQRASDIPATYAEILAADDDDGDLSNGTPHECLINETFGRLHGLRDLGVDHEPLAVQPPERDGYAVRTRVTGLGGRCADDRVASATLRWTLQGGGARISDEANIEPMREDGDGVLAGVIPPQAAGSVVYYQVVIELADGGIWRFPANLAEPAYELYVGEVVPLYCTDFETDPFAEGWSHGLDEGDPGAGADDWQWGVLAGSAYGHDPVSAFSGTRVLGNDLGGDSYDGEYQARKTNHALSPVIDVGDYSDVRIHFWRWLTVEDARWDTASVYVNGAQAWRNTATDTGIFHHLDTQWVFQDVPASPYLDGKTVQVELELASDVGLEFGGWTIDDFCVVARADSICGDGRVTGVEQCDDGAANHDTAPSACRTNCSLYACGDGIVDIGEQCDDGNDDDVDDCTTLCLRGPTAGCGGCRAGGSAGEHLGSWALGVGLLGLLALRRRRAARGLI